MSEQASEAGRIRLLIADDHTMFRHGIRALLSSVPDIELVGEAAGGEEAVALAAQLQPDVILMDIKMPGTNGIEATRRITRANPAAKVVVLTMLEDDDSVFAAMRAGARGNTFQIRIEVTRGILSVSSRELAKESPRGIQVTRACCGKQVQ
ncbi:MAG: response regulator transcription factor, partial [Chloroflexota bacterium]|nr:response regulator transcription factor [Chloroflexota bacterium]